MRGASLPYAIVHAGPRQFNVVHVPTGHISYYGRTRAMADAELARRIEIHNRPPVLYEEAIERFVALSNDTAGQW